MKRVILCVIMLMLASCSYAEIQEFKYFSLDIPEDWSAEESNNEVKITADDNTGALTIIADEPAGNTIRDIASAFAVKFGGTELKLESDDIYTFEFSNGEGQATITGNEDFYMLIVASGFETNGDVLSEILSSLEMK